MGDDKRDKVFVEPADRPRPEGPQVTELDPVDKTPLAEAAIRKARGLSFAKLVREAESGGESESPLLDALGA